MQRSAINTEERMSQVLVPIAEVNHERCLLIAVQYLYPCTQTTDTHNYTTYIDKNKPDCDRLQ